MQITACTGALDRLRVEYHALASLVQAPQVTATVQTLREDLNQVMECQGNASGATSGQNVDVEETFTRVNPRLENLKAAVHAQSAPTGLLEMETEQPTPVETRSKKLKSKKRKTRKFALNSD